MLLVNSVFNVVLS